MVEQEIINAIERHEPLELAELKNRTPFEDCVRYVMKTLSERSRRIYRNTYDKWLSWASENGVHALDVNMSTVALFLKDADGTQETLRRHLCAMRKLAEIMAILDGNTARTNYELLKQMKTPAGKTETERNQRAMSPAEIDAAIRAWRGNSLTERRNMAVIALLAFTGVRRAELVALQWRDVNWDNATVKVRHGKGDKKRIVTVFGGVDGFAMNALKAWKKALEKATGGEKRVYVFPSLGKGGNVKADKPMPTDTVWRIVRETMKRSGIENMTPHTFRHTLITELARHDVATAQAQAGHASASTTLGYAHEIEAENRHQYRLRYGAMTKADKELFEAGE
ncbi:MAG: site-specific integrase [Chloroflexi bacterium]|nr:MAG: site-specific integrase [Chloroflexota bacterium]